MVQFGKTDSIVRAENKSLSMDGVSVGKLAAAYGTPLFVFSENRVRRNIARIRRANDDLDRPVKICYAAKANPLIGILRAIKDAGCDLEVNSGGELWKALK